MNLLFDQGQAMLAALTGAAGVALGLLYFAALRHAVGMFTGGRGWLLPSALTLARIAGIVIALAVAAHFGAIPLLAAFMGFLVARGISIRLARSAG